MSSGPAVLRFRAMASPCEIRVDGAQPLAARLEAAAHAQAEVQRIEQRYSRYRDDSVISRINAAAGRDGFIDVDDETASLLDFAATLHEASGGLFDITSGVLRRAWDFRADRPPEPSALEALLPRVGWHRVERRPGALRLPAAGMEIDFGGIGKEYAADRAASLLVSQGHVHGYVNLGGDIRVLGPREDGGAWQLGIQHPRDAAAVLARVPVRDGALATSGDYERFIVHEGRRYCHILDPRTGWPVTHWQSVSVLAPACLAAGALCTIAMLLGDDALPFLRDEGVGYLAIDAHGHCHTRAA